MEHQAAADAWPIFLALQESALGHFMRASPFLYPTVEILHIIGFVTLVGSILALDLRLLGLGRQIPVQPMAEFILPLSRFGFFLAITMGFLLFSADAAHVVSNPAFRAKLLLILAALINVAIAHIGPWRRHLLWRTSVPAGAKITALLSLALWLGVITLGRLIAYY
jgi:hypothetical protein